jgi:hypothetical protein
MKELLGSAGPSTIASNESVESLTNKEEKIVNKLKNIRDNKQASELLRMRSKKGLKMKLL